MTFTVSEKKEFKAIKVKEPNTCPIKDILYEISQEEIQNLENSLNENNDDYFDFNRDTLDLYEYNIIEDENLENEGEQVKINENFYKNIPLNSIKGVKKLLNDIKTLHCNSINFDFIKNKELM